jgi:hypothetical protein
MKRLLLLLVLALPIAAQTYIYYPSPGSTLQPNQQTTFYWTSSNGPTPSYPTYAYYLYLSRNGYYQSDLGFFGTNSTAFTYTVPSSGTLYITLLYNPCSTCGYYGAEAFYNISAPQATFTVVSPPNGTQIPFDFNGGASFQVQSSASPIIFEAGYGGYGATDVASIQVYTYGGTVNVSLDSAPLKNNTQAGDLFVTLYYAGTFKYFYYPLPSPPQIMHTTSATLASTSEGPDDNSGVYVPPAGAQYIPVKMASGEVVRVKRGDQIKIGQVKYSSSPDPNGAGTQYSYTIDNREAARVRLGNPLEPATGITATTQPKGWLPGPGWGQWKNADLSPTATYSVLSPNLPGVLPLYVQGDFDGLVDRINGRTPPDDAGVSPGETVGLGRKDNIHLANAMSIYNNSILEYVIGPVFDPQPKMADVLAKVKTWSKDYGFTFLAPLVTASDPKSALDSINPSTQLETDILSSLRVVMDRVGH